MGSSQQPDYFVEIPSAQMYGYNQQGNFYQTTQQPQMMPMGQMNINCQKSLPNFQQSQQAQMQLQLANTTTITNSSKKHTPTKKLENVQKFIFRDFTQNKFPNIS